MQKSYTDLKRCDVEYEVGNEVFLSVSLWKKVLRFSWKNKLIPHFIGSYRIIRHVGPVDYQVELLLTRYRLSKD
ncbi:hypothetical protein GQ457_04G015240 [Hibiscus cannabinus]